MARSEIRLGSGIVTTGAELSLLEREQAGVGSAMRQMAGGTGLGGRRMRQPPREVARIVAAQAKLPFRLGQHARVVRAVWVVTLGALAYLGMLVARRKLLFLLGVATETEVGLFGLQLQGADQTVRFVTGRALAGGERSVAHADRADDVRMTLETLVALLKTGATLQLGLRRAQADESQHHGAQDDREAAWPGIRQRCAPP